MRFLEKWKMGSSRLEGGSGWAGSFMIGGTSIATQKVFQSIFKLSKSNPYFRKSPLTIFCSMVILEVWQHRNIYIVNTIFETSAPVSLNKNILRVILLCLFFMYFAHGFGLWLPCFPYLYFVGPSSQKMYV